MVGVTVYSGINMFFQSETVVNVYRLLAVVTVYSGVNMCFQSETVVNVYRKLSVSTATISQRASDILCQCPL